MAVRRSKHDRINAKKARLARKAAAKGEARKASAAAPAS
jgi:hypothetical protein